MAYRRTHEEVVRDEAYDEQYARYEVKHTRWWNTKWYLDCVQSDTWRPDLHMDDADALKGFYGFILRTQEFSEEERPKVIWIVEQMNYAYDEELTMIEEKEKMEHRGWCHKAEEKQHEIDMKRNEIWGMQDAIKILKGEAELGVEPKWVFIDPTAPPPVVASGNENIGCAVIFVIMFLLLFGCVANL